MNTHTTHPRTIKSFVNRNRRLSEKQQRCYQELWPRYGLTLNNDGFNTTHIFGNNNPTVIEIGFGNGVFLLRNARENPCINFLGIEVYLPGICHLLTELAQQPLDNVKILQADAAAILKQHIAPASVDAIYILFPDPWPKTRHHKRRLIQLDFCCLLKDKLKVGGELHLATDWQDYARHMQQTVAQVPALQPIQDSQFPIHICTTKFAARGQRLGHISQQLHFQRQT